ncbi:MAG: flagellar hook-basal body complex protein [Deltaproteobacteria bacterium]|nr:flagellar hook-basal body complex protein [Deltaproteobacteria bacterium]MCX7952848.1 flagellar hook-basal body complex protein [Deltaproteobacteria bacterium]
MDNGTYSVATAGFFLFKKLDILNNNLANTNTPGYKQDKVIQTRQVFEETLASKFNPISPYARPDFERFHGSKLVDVKTDLRQGAIQHTGRPLDVAIGSSDEFFVVQTPVGIMLTRAGTFEIDSNQDLVTPSGYKVLGDGGIINVAGASNVKISPNGKITGTVGGQEVTLGKLQVVKINGEVKKIGLNLFEAKEGFQVVENPRLVPGSVEQSNVELIPTMIELISTNKQFELFSKIIKTLEELNQSAINGARP